MRGQPVLEAEALREVEDVRVLTRTERCDRAQLDRQRQTEDAGRGDAVALRARHVMLAIRRRGRKIEAEEVVAGLLRAAMRPREGSAPMRLVGIRPVELRLDGVVPVALPFRIGLDDVAESRNQRGAAKA